MEKVIGVVSLLIGWGLALSGASTVIDLLVDGFTFSDLFLVAMAGLVSLFCFFVGLVAFILGVGIWRPRRGVNTELLKKIGEIVISVFFVVGTIYFHYYFSILFPIFIEEWGFGGGLLVGLVCILEFLIIVLVVGYWRNWRVINFLQRKENVNE